MSPGRSPLYEQRKLPERGGDGGHDLADKPVEVSVGGSLDVQVPAADVVDSLVIYHEGTVGMFEGGVCGKDGVVGFHYSGSHLREQWREE